MRHHVGIPLLAALILGCNAKKSASPVRDAATTSAKASAPIVAGSTITGTVREVIPVQSYLYLRLETQNGEIWTAVNQATLLVGATVTVYNVMLMEQFASPTLKRTFARIYFGSLVPVESSPSSAVATTDTTAAAAADAMIGAVAPATGSGAHTVGGLWRQKDRLTSTTVSVRGVVVRYNAGVMGKNWIHLQDGSGVTSAGTHDLAATSIEEAAVGDTIILMGIARTNVDVGGGYKFVLLLENARIVGR